MLPNGCADAHKEKIEYDKRRLLRSSVMSSSPRRASGPLNGIKVLDLSAYIAGPYACSLLADMGAEVIKIEPPSGDTLRLYPSTLEAEARVFLGVNRSKRGAVIDLKKPEGAAILMRLIESADVLVHNFRPSVPSRLGIDYATLKARNPRLVYCALTGYGDTGPLKEKAGYDQVLQSITGICTFQGRDKGEPEIVRGSVVDFYAAALLSNAVCAALYNRERTGEGQYVGVSLLASALAMQSGRFVWANGEGRDAGRDMSSGGITGIHPAKEGSIYISANTPHFWRALCKLIGMEEMAADSNYDTVRKRAQRASEIVPKLRAALKARTALEWEEIFGDQVPCGAVRPIEDMFDYPQVVKQGLVAEFEHPQVGTYRGLAGAFKFNGMPAPEPFSAPALGQHTGEILAQTGYSDAEIGRLRRLGVIGD
jgi:formyl-CoA transferase